MPAAKAPALSHTKGVKAVVPHGTIIIGDANSATRAVASSHDRRAGHGDRCGAIMGG
jgi:hypothetical protein